LLIVKQKEQARLHPERDISWKANIFTHGVVLHYIMLHQGQGLPSLQRVRRAPLLAAAGVSSFTMNPFQASTPTIPYMPLTYGTLTWE